MRRRPGLYGPYQEASGISGQGYHCDLILSFFFPLYAIISRQALRIMLKNIKIKNIYRMKKSQFLLGLRILLLRYFHSLDDCNILEYFLTMHGFASIYGF